MLQNIGNVRSCEPDGSSHDCILSLLTSYHVMARVPMSSHCISTRGLSKVGEACLHYSLRLGAFLPFVCTLSCLNISVLVISSHHLSSPLFPCYVIAAHMISSHVTYTLLISIYLFALLMEAFRRIS